MAPVRTCGLHLSLLRRPVVRGVTSGESRPCLTHQKPRAILHSMRARPIFRLQAFLLAALVAALASGPPSHHHEGPGSSPVLEDAGHHGHGVQLVEQADRLTSQTFDLATPTLRSVEVRAELLVVTTVVVWAPVPIARGRPPPSDRPRAPPVSV
jgi:hypothetical protein